ncbi:MAG: hypothetical protein ACLP1Q_20835 [Solirubrobacteraceae bacterium]
MHRLPSDAERVTDLLPRPPLTSGNRDLAGLDALCQTPQRKRCT